ncbi:MAG: GNAT family N-acetyltransferase [Mogibacterium sp.]|nr:GNAT family N-acetyltransferase [Mogibacterium sp.]
MIYKATMADIDAVADLATQLWTWHSKEDMVARYTAQIPNENCAVFVYAAKDGDPISGYAHCQLRRDYVEGCTTSPVGYLEGIFVSPENRSKGVARELLKAGEDWAREKGCTEFASDCELSDILSSRFHTKAGFKVANRIIHFTKKLD